MNILIFLGPPGSGKGTQTRLLAKRLLYPLFSMGEALRREIHAETSLGKNLKPIIDRGMFPDNTLILDVFKNYIENLSPQKGVILDGVPRDLVQAEGLDEIFQQNGHHIQRVIHLNVDHHDLIRRLSMRYICVDCHAMYARGVYEAKVQGICDVCGGKNLNRRSDDDPEIAQKRLQLHNDREHPVLNFYTQRSLLTEVDGDASIQIVHQRIIDALREID